jgi:hypothetical protein
MGLSIAKLLHVSGAKVRAQKSFLRHERGDSAQVDIPNAIGCTLMHYIAGENATGPSNAYYCH